MIEELKSQNFINEVDFGYESKFTLTELGKSEVEKVF